MEAIDRIETVLEQREQTPYALCKFLGINQSSYSTWKARNTLPPAKYIADIARFLHVSTDYILTGKDLLTLTSRPKLTPMMRRSC